MTDQTLVGKEQPFSPSREKKETDRKYRVRTEAANVALAVFVVVIVYLGNLRYFYNGYREDDFTDVLRISAWVLSLMQVVLLFRRLHLVRHSKMRRRPDGTLLTLEIVAHLFLLPPRLNYEFTFYLLGTSVVVSMSDFFFLIALLRLYHVSTFLYFASKFVAPKAQVHCEIQRVESNQRWIVRCTIEEMTIFSLFAIWLVIALIHGLCLNVMEHGTLKGQTDTWNSIWCMIVSQAAIGYGDFTAVTHIGRAVSVIDIIIGIMVLSMIVKKSAELLVLSVRESQLYRGVCYRAGINGFMRDLSARLIQRWWMLILARRDRVNPHLAILIKFMRVQHQFRLQLKKLQALMEATLSEEMAAFETRVKKRLKGVEDECAVLERVNLQAFEFLSQEYSVLKKVRSMGKWVKKRMGKIRRSIRISNRVGSRASISPHSTVIVKIARRKAREITMRKLVNKIKEMNGRPEQSPMSSHIASIDSFNSAVRDFSSATGADPEELDSRQSS